MQHDFRLQIFPLHGFPALRVDIFRWQFFILWKEPVCRAAAVHV